MGRRWVWIIVLGLIASSPVRAQTIWEPNPSLDPNTIKLRPGQTLPQLLVGMSNRNCPSRDYVHMKTWVCVVWYRTLLTSPDLYYGKDIHTHGFVRMAAGGQLFLVPSEEIKGGPERIRIEGAAPSLRPLKDGEAVYIAGTFGPQDAAHDPGLGVLSNAYDVLPSGGTPDGGALLPDLKLRTPKAVTGTSPKLDTTH
jgi:hypothetical protein